MSNGFKELEQYIDMLQKVEIEYIKTERLRNIEVKAEILENVYQASLNAFDYAKFAPSNSTPLKIELWITDYNASFLLPKIEAILKFKDISIELFNKTMDLWERSMALTARRSFEHFIIYMELDRSDQRRVYLNKRDAILEPFVYYFNKMVFDEHFQFMSDSKPPSGGKTFCVNYGSAWRFGINKDASILRISVAEDNVLTASRQIKAIMESKRYLDVFPYFKNLVDTNQKIFEIEQTKGWKITGADVEASHLAVPLGGQIEGKRANELIIVDDSLKQDDAYNEVLMGQNWQKYLTSILARADSETVKKVIIGTMWHPNDLLGKNIEYLSKGATLHEGKFKYTQEIWRDGHLIGVIIRTPMLDPDTDETTCKYVLSTFEARNRRDEIEPFLWHSAYQQDPIAPEGLILGEKELMYYDEIKVHADGKETILFNGNTYELNDTARMSVDPTRKGKDYVSCPIFKSFDDGNYEALVDVIYKGKAMDEVIGDIINKIVLHNIHYMVVENNTDTSLKTLILERLDRYNRAHNCNYIVEIEEEYATTRKKERIREESHVIKKRIVFMSKKLYTMASEMGQFMQSLTRYSDLHPNKNDDAPDSVALFSKKAIRSSRRRKATARVMSMNQLYGV